MTLTEILPWIAGFAFFAFGLYSIVSNAGLRNGWIIPALLSAAFFIWSVFAIATEGPLGFWTEHTRNLWGNQIWFDLLLAASVGWVLLVPQAKRLGMRLLPWFLLIVATGSIGFLAMLARFVYLRDRSPADGTRP